MRFARVNAVWAVLAVAIVGLMPAVLKAEVVYSNFSNAADVDDSVTARPVGFSNVSNPNQQYAQGFTSGTANLVVQSISVGLGADTEISTAQVRIFSSALVSGTAMPNSPVATFTLSGSSGVVLDQTPYTFTGSYKLDPSTPYWVVVSDSALPTANSFNYYDVESDLTPTGVDGYAYLGTRRTTNGTTWLNFATGDALSISISAVPEPSTYALAAVGLGLAGFVRARRRKAAV